MASSFSLDKNSLNGAPPMVADRKSGTMSSPWPPRTSAWTSPGEQPTASATKHLKRAVSSTPAIPTTWVRGNPVIF